MHAIDNTTTTSVHILSDVGTGRSFVTLVDDDRYSALITSVSARISQKARSVVLKTPPVLVDNWRAIAKDMTDRLAALGIRQASFVGVGSCAALAEDLALSAPKSVRSLIVIDSPYDLTRPGGNGSLIRLSVGYPSVCHYASARKASMFARTLTDYVAQCLRWRQLEPRTLSRPNSRPLGPWRQLPGICPYEANQRRKRLVSWATSSLSFRTLRRNVRKRTVRRPCEY